MIGGRTTATLRVVARHADLWNIPGSDLADAVRRSDLLDQLCGEIDRDPASIVRSIYLRVAYDQMDATRDGIAQAVDAGFGHVVLGLPAPYPDNVARRITDELIKPASTAHRVLRSGGEDAGVVLKLLRRLDRHRASLQLPNRRSHPMSDQGTMGDAASWEPGAVAGPGPRGRG